MDIQMWLVETLASIVEVEASDIDPRTPFADFGLGSVETTEVSGALEDWVGRKLSPVILYEYDDIQALSTYLATHLATSND